MKNGRDHFGKWLEQVRRNEEIAANERAIADLVMILGLLLVVLLIPVAAHLSTRSSNPAHQQVEEVRQ